jgi:RimJ/RimL family protein N-acetyltransferase
MTDAPARTALTLRALQPADCDRLLTWIDSSDALWQWSGARSFTWPLDRGQLLRDLAAHAGSSVELLAGIDEDGQMVAHVLVDAQHHHGLGFIGRVAVAPEQRGRGVGAALMRATIRHGFEELGLHRLQLTVYTFNVAAIATYRSVGFVVEGLARASTRGSTGRWDGLTMSLLEPDYRHPPTFGAGIRIAGPRDAAAIATLLVLVIRPLIAGPVLRVFGANRNEAIFGVWGGLKGAVPILLGSLPLARGLAEGNRLFALVGLVVLFSLLVQGLTLGRLARRLEI